MIWGRQPEIVDTVELITNPDDPRCARSTGSKLTRGTRRFGGLRTTHLIWLINLLPHPH